MIEPLESCISANDDQAPPEPISSHEFLLQRLREINLA
jgi:hypothetical protein